MSLPRMLRRLLPGDEVLIAGFGLGAAAIIACAGGLLWFLASDAERRTLADSRAAMLDVLGDSMGQSVETLLGANELSAVRRLVTDTARTGDLALCRVVLPDGGIIADADPAAITVPALPEAWPPATAEASPAARRIELAVPGRGRASLLLTPKDQTAALKNEMPMLVGFVAAGALAGLALIYRAGRTRTRSLGAVHAALSALAEGEREPSALEIAETMGPKAKAWNDLLRELTALRKQDLLRRARDESAGAGGKQDLLTAACDALWIGLIVTDDAMNIRYANGAAAVFLSARREALSGAALTSHLNDPAAASALQGLADGTSRGRIVIETGLGAGREEAVFRVSARRLRQGEGAASLILIEDVTQQRIADKARNAFVAQATHELRTPLTNIRLYVEDLIDKPDADPPTRAKHLDVVNQEARRLERIVGDMLSVSEIEAGTMKLATDDVRLTTLFHDLEADFAFPARSKNITLKFVLPPKLPVIVGDRDKIVLAVSNLIGNALKYTLEGGGVTVTVHDDAGTVRIDVADSGIGIAEEECELVFERFYRSKDARIGGITGSGLGLALARQVVRLHGGDISLTSELNKGSTFTLTLPARAPMSLAA